MADAIMISHSHVVWLDIGAFVAARVHKTAIFIVALPPHCGLLSVFTRVNTRVPFIRDNV